LLAGFHYGSVSGARFGGTYSGTSTEFEGAAGASIKYSNSFSFYFDGILSFQTISTKYSFGGSDYKIDLTSRDPFGINAGFEYSWFGAAKDDSLKAGLEYNLLYETGYTWFIRMAF
jgi:hypothetical protein